jgi:hypothetical protein
VRYDQLTEKLEKQYNHQTKLIEEGAPLVMLGIASIGGAAAYVYKHGGIPENIKNLADGSVLYQVLSIFDPTGVMSWPYVQLAYERLKKEPDSWWYNALFVISIFATFPVVGLGARAVTRLVTTPLRIPGGILKGLKYIFTGGGKAIKSNPRLMEIYTQSLARGYSSPGKVVQTEAFRKAISKTMGVQVSDDMIKAIAKKSGIKLADNVAPGLAAKIGPKLAKGAAAVGAAAAIARPIGRAARTFTAGGEAFNNADEDGTAEDVKGLFDRITSIKRTPVTRGQKVKYGHIGGAVR